MLIALLFALFMLPCLDARAVGENSLTETARCEFDLETLPVCVVTEGIARLLLQPLRTIRLITEAVGDFISSFSLKELLKAALGAVTVPLSLIIHTPEEIKFAIESINVHLVPAFKRILEVIEDWRDRPQHLLKVFFSHKVLFPLYSVFEVMEGVVVAVSQSGFQNYHKAYMQVKRMAQRGYQLIAFFMVLYDCTDILSPNSCDNVYYVFEKFVINPAVYFVNGLMVVAPHVIHKLKDVVIPILDKLSPSKLQAYCSKVLSEGNCARIFLHIREMDKFGGEEIRKVVHLVNHVLQWVIKHIFTDNVLHKLKPKKVINNF